MSVLTLAESHAKDCPACADKWSDLTLLHAGLDQLRDSAQQMEAPPRVEASLRAAFHEVRETRSGPRIGRSPWATVWASAAALLLLVAGVTLYITPGAKSPVTVARKSVEPAERSLRKARHQQPLPALSANRAATAVRKNGRISGKQKQQPGGPAPEQVADKAGTDDNLTVQASRAGGEISQEAPAAAGEEFSLNGGSNIIRVTMPLSSLSAVGVPMHPDMPDRQVTADVAMNPFGAIVAIRLVK